MIDELRKRFLPRFVQSGQDRLARARSAVEEARGAAAAAELHALAGEASVLGLFDISTLAREAEKAARRSHTAGPATAEREEANGQCALVLERIAAAIDALATGDPGQVA